MSAPEIIENIWIPLKDGTRLAARLWLPAVRPAPCVLEYIPYRKTDGTRGRDNPMHGFFADNGLAAIRVDMRGTGESEGLCHDEYLPIEQADAVEVIAWIAEQEWCSGAVGMMGKSWGGFNCLQVAAHNPPALKAIITVYSTDDRFGDDIHYMGGCLLNDNLWWGAIMLAYQARPLDRRLVGPSWRDQWLKRLEAMPLWPALWLAHPTRDAYWKQGSVGENYAAIRCPVLAIGGWADSYTNTVPRLLQHLAVPRQGVIGPWAHVYPQDGVPTPAYDFLGHAVAWWKHWLAGEDTGVEARPMLTAYVEDARAPDATLPASPGRWVAEAVWPSPTITDRIFAFGDHALGTVASDDRLSIRSPLYAGVTSGEWMGTGCAGEMPTDQRLDDGFSLLFDTDPLDAPLDILGNPVVELTFASDKPAAQVCLRLNDVAPDGTSMRVTYAVRNLAHRDGFEAPEALEPGEVYTVTIPLEVAGHRFPAGHRIRLAISTAYWPIVWPAAEAATLTIHCAGSQLKLPVRPVVADEAEPVMASPRQGAPTPVTKLKEGTLKRSVSLDAMTDTMTYVTEGRGGVFGEGVLRFDEVGVTLSHDLTRRLSVNGSDPLSAVSEVDETYVMDVDGQVFRTEASTRLTADRSHFRMEATLQVFEADVEVFSRHWDERLPRFPL
ncbi:CocE/NonD family hydrolase [Oryzibacter oryziterrae]|uniref:CocE/NonD family hydrolase n=1 Tax=Oryzibacter oryziterrae TaxID=2766474 RepID=UPI001F023A5C|nr:CocE/NonD family hydrolase [Oryzibacter oryziterrae]